MVSEVIAFVIRIGGIYFSSRGAGLNDLHHRLGGREQNNICFWFLICFHFPISKLSDNYLAALYHIHALGGWLAVQLSAVEGEPVGTGIFGKRNYSV